MWCVCVVRLSSPFNFPFFARSVCIVDRQDCERTLGQSLPLAFFRRLLSRLYIFYFNLRVFIKE